jgi:hypothetical protein
VSEPAVSTDGTTSSPTLTLARDAGRPTWWPQMLLVVVLLGAVWVSIGAAARPLQQTCDPALAPDVCLETIDAALRKGMPHVHPLLLAAHAEPGPAAQPDQFGHRATVAFDVLGVPGPTSVRLFFDTGGHWGGIASRGAAELALWAVAQGVVAAAAAAGGLWLLLRRRRARR